MEKRSKMSKPMVIMVILILFFAISNPASGEEPSGLIAQWKLDETSGVVAKDSVGTNDGLLVNGPVWTEGLIDGALELDGANDYVDLGSTVADGLAQGSFTAWVYPFNLSDVCGGRNFAYIIGASQSTGGELGIRVNGDGSGWAAVNTLAAGGGQCIVFPQGTFALGSWHYVVLTWDSFYWKLYVNGSLKSQIANSAGTTSASNKTTLGKAWDGCPWEGVIDEVCYYNRALSAEEIELLYEFGLLGPLPVDVVPTELKFWAFENGSDPNSKTLSIQSSAGEILEWEISENCPWLEAVPSSGTCQQEPSEITINIDISGLTVGHHECALTISDTNGTYRPCVVYVQLDIVEMAASPFWKNQIVFPDEPFKSEALFENDPQWVKFTILLEPYDPNIVYFQDSREYIFHYDFATQWLAPFIGMTVPEFFDAALYASGQVGVLGAVILPPVTGSPPAPAYNEYGIQFVRYDPFSKEEIAAMFEVVKSSVTADAGVTGYYFPTYEQSELTEADKAWLLSQGIPVGSLAQWFEGNICYSEGWAIGQLKYFAGNQIAAAFQSGQLRPDDILLTDGVPAEIPMVAGIMTLSPTAPNSHVAILARTYGIPFAYLGLSGDISKANGMVGLDIVICVDDNAGSCLVTLRNLDEFSNNEIIELLEMKEPRLLSITPTSPFGSYTGDTDNLSPADIKYFGGKAANYGILRDAISENCLNAMAISFDLWNEFLNQPLVPSGSVVIGPGEYLLFWADNDQEQGLTHTNFKLSAGGEYIGLYDTDGTTLIDGIAFGPQSTDVSYGRSPDGSENWVLFSAGTATPGTSNPGTGGPASGLFINEFMAANSSTIQDPHGSGYPDWIELYNAGPNAVDLGGMYLTDDVNNPTKWMIPAGITGSTLREEISSRLSGYSYPPSDMAALAADLSAIRSLFKNDLSTSFTQVQKDAVIAALLDPQYGFDANSNIRFRSSTNVEDSSEFIGAGMYESYSGCLADELDADNDGPCICDSDESNERGVFRAIRKVYASFYNDNAFLERLRHGVNEAQVGMALLVHNSFTDEFELANGVATLEKNSSGPDKIVRLVTQKGAVSVANPDSSAIPEEVQIYVNGTTGIKTATLLRQSSLVILGDKVMQWQGDYNDLTDLLLEVSAEFESITGKNDYILDFEYKKLLPGGAAMPAGGLVVKQVREIPRLAAEQLICPAPILPTQCANQCSYSCPGSGCFYREHNFTSPDGVFISTKYYLYCPPGWVCKIMPLSQWVETSIIGLTGEPIYLYSCLSGCYSAGHHNWGEAFLFEPMFEPGISQNIVDQLWLMNVKGIKFTPVSISYYDFDGREFYTKPVLGDYDHDGDVDFADLETIAQRWLEQDCGLCGRANLNLDNKVDFKDFAEFGKNWRLP